MSKNLGSKSLIIMGIFLVSIIIILFGGALLYNKFFFRKDYKQVEEIMFQAAKDYFEENKEKLPKNINDTITLTDETLVNNGNMDTIVSYTKNNEVTCEGEVTITNINGDYRYATTLNCGEEYKTQTLNDYINENVEIVTSGNGLYKLNDELVYRGEDVNNYVILNKNTYQIIKFKNNHPVIILATKDESSVWDDRYNIATNYSSGINNYDISRIKDYLNELYQNTNKDALLDNDSKLLVTSHDLPIGRRNDKDTDKTGYLENATVLTNQYIGLLPVNDFLNASLDENCTFTTSQSCTNYNYLNKFGRKWWTITASSEKTDRVYIINKTATLAQTNNVAYVRPVLYLAKDTIYVSGDGSQENPYIIK